MTADHRRASPDVPAKTTPARTKDSARPRRTWRSVLTRVLLVLIVITVAVAAYAYSKLRAEPAHWVAHRQRMASFTEQQRQDMALTVEQRILGITHVGPGAPTRAGGAPASAGAAAVISKATGVRTVSLTVDEANAWLGARLPQWVANGSIQLPKGVTEPMVAIEGGRPILAFRVQTTEVDQVVSLVFNLRMLEDGRALRQIVSVRGGDLPLPGEALTGHLKKIAPTQKESARIDEMARLFEGEPFDPVMAMPGDKTRTVRLRDITFNAEGVELTLETAPKRKK